MKLSSVASILAKLGIKHYPATEVLSSKSPSIPSSDNKAATKTPADVAAGLVTANPTAVRSITSRLTPEQIEANRQHNLQRLAAFDSKAAAARLLQQVEANLRAAAERARLEDERGNGSQ